MISAQLKARLGRLRAAYSTFVMEAHSFMTALDAECGFAPSDDPSMAMITEAVCKEFGVTVSALLGKIRSSEMVSPRWFAMLLMHQLIGKDDCQIARYFSRDRSGVYYARIELSRRLVNTSFDAARFADLKKQLNLKLIELKRSA